MSTDTNAVSSSHKYILLFLKLKLGLGMEYFNLSGGFLLLVSWPKINIIEIHWWSKLKNEKNKKKMKSKQKWTDIVLAAYHSLSLRIQFECGKMRTRITPNTDTFYAVLFQNISPNFGLNAIGIPCLD